MLLFILHGWEDYTGINLQEASYIAEHYVTESER
jgi:hypothetical protein